MAFSGFPHGVRFTPVPNPLFGELLEQIDDMAELRCTLRLVWLLHQKKGSPRWVSHRELMSDWPLLRASSTGGGDAEAEVTRGLQLALGRGTILASRVAAPGSERYTLNTEEGRRAAKAEPEDFRPVEAEPTPWEGPTERPYIYDLYEKHLGILNSTDTEEMKAAAKRYTLAWIEDAFREAIRSNQRSWPPVSRTLERWQGEGRHNGEPGGHPKETGYQEYFGRTGYQEYFRRTGYQEYFRR